MWTDVLTSTEVLVPFKTEWGPEKKAIQCPSAATAAFASSSLEQSASGSADPSIHPTVYN